MGVLAKVVVLEQRSFDKDGVTSLRFDTYITEDGVPISAPEHHRVTLTPGQSLDDDVVVDKNGTRMALPEQVLRLCDAEWTEDVVDAYQAKQEAAAARVLAASQPRRET